MKITVDIRQGPLEGSSSRGVVRFLGVPYAAAPFGPRRMLPPIAAPSWSETRDATRFGPTVPKSPYPSPYNELFDEPTIPGEECLNLNVWTPGTAGDRPVFVWIHGGAFVNGSGAVPQYDGSAFARDGVVAVTINYRLGADGFLDTGDGNTNVGLLDQIAALEWVRDNIEAFGGDPSRVTIGGESAGAMSVATLLASPMAAGLFSGAIMQSGAGHHALSATTAQKVAGELATRLGVGATRNSIAEVPLEALLETQAALSAEIQTSGDPERWGEVAANLMPFEPVIDGSVVPTLPIEGIRSGSGAAVPVLLGTNRDENLLFMAPSGALDMISEDVLRFAVARYGFGDVDSVVAAYGEGQASPGHTMAAISTDWMFRIPAIRLAEARDGGPAPSYLYEFRWESPARNGILGACHALELPFVFETLGTPGAELMTGPDAPLGLAEEMHRCWVRFIEEADPGWAPYSRSRTVRIFGGGDPTEQDPGAERRELWQGLR